MKDQLKTIQTGLAIAIDAEGFVDKPVRRALLEARTALSELERMAGEPVSHATVAGALFDFMGWLTSRRARLVLSSVDDAAPAADAIKEFAAMRGLSINDAQVQTWKEQLATPPAQQPQYEAGDMASAHNDGFRAGVASVAQQPQARPDFNDEWTGYLKDGETPFERLMRERKDLGALTKLYQRALEENERLKAQQPRAELLRSLEDLLESAEWLTAGCDEESLSDDVCRAMQRARATIAKTTVNPATQQAEAVPEMHDALCPALTGGDCTCTPPATIDKAWAQFCGGIGHGPDAPYPGMIEAFEAHYGQTFTDKDWRKETGVWAAAWKAAKAHGEAAPQQAEAVASNSLESGGIKPQQAEAVPPGFVVDRGFRWDGEKQQHIPQLVIEFESVPANGPCDAQGWKDRDAVAQMFAAAQGEKP